MPIRVAIVEDCAEVRDGLTFLIKDSAECECVASCSTAEEAMSTLPLKHPDVVLMDIGLPHMSGIQCIFSLKKAMPGAQFMVLTVFEDDARIFESLAAGATGFLLKTTPPAKLLEAINDVHLGGSPMSNQIARRLVREFQKPAQSSPETASLSARELEVLQLLAKGFLYKEIADHLHLSRHTIRTHIRNIYSKLHVRTRTEAVVKTFPH
jgi:DNA-binding NarL/FixJ family response regulator